MGKLIETKTEYRELIIMRAGWQADKESEGERERTEGLKEKTML